MHVLLLSLSLTVSLNKGFLPCLFFSCIIYLILKTDARTCGVRDVAASRESSEYLLVISLQEEQEYI